MCLVKNNQNMTGCLGVKRFRSHQLLFWMVLLIVGYIMLVLSSVGVKTRIFKTSSNGSTWPVVTRRRLSSEQNEAPASNFAIKTADYEKMKILYIVTSGGKSNSGNERFQRQVGPVVLESVASLNENAHWHVDVFLVLGYDEFTLQEEFEKQLHEINPNTQLRTWIDALPIFYGCESWEASRTDPVGGGTNCRNHEHNKGIEMNEAALFHGKSQLARQHRFVVKDFLSEYDFFLAFEDDMLINKYHVEYHMEWMTKLRRMAQEAPNGGTSQVATNNDDSWRVQTLTSKQLVRLRPGLLRVEVAKDDTLDTPLQGSLDVGVTDAMVMEASSHINASRCCHRPVHVTDTPDHAVKPELSPKDLILWEAAIFGFGIRKLGDTWIGTLPGPTGPFPLQDFWSGRAVNRTKRDRPRRGDPKLIAQSAGKRLLQSCVLLLSFTCSVFNMPSNMTSNTPSSRP